MTKKAAGLILFRRTTKMPEVFLVHPGGPFWKNKDLGAWSIPKGEYDGDEEPLKAAIREFTEETGLNISGKFISLTPVKLKSGKIVSAWAIEKNIDASAISSNTFSLEWPPKTGRTIEVPEVDKGEWFTLPIARSKINQAQSAFIDELEKLIAQKKAI